MEWSRSKVLVRTVNGPIAPKGCRFSGRCHNCPLLSMDVFSGSMLHLVRLIALSVTDKLAEARKSFFPMAL